MARSTYARNYDLIDWSKPIARPPRESVTGKRSGLSAPRLLSDTIEPTQSMADGEYYTSKSALRGTYRPSGNPDGKSYVEVGDDRSVTDPNPRQNAKPDREGINASLNRAFSQVGLGA